MRSTSSTRRRAGTHGAHRLPGRGTFCLNDYPAWSPDGRQIAFVHAEHFDADGNPLDEQVWVMDADGSHQRQLTTDAPFKDQVPDWSPTERRSPTRRA
jgi:Tol biopolymer transport system component